MFGYCVWRLAIESLKPIPHVYAFGLSGLQWLALLGIVYYLPSLPRMWRGRSEHPA